MSVGTSPYAARIVAMWQQYRTDIMENFPDPPGLSIYPMQPQFFLNNPALKFSTQELCQRNNIILNTSLF